MNKVDEMKKIIKPLIKECLTEILMEEGLMKLIKENTELKIKEERSYKEEAPTQKYVQKEQQFMQDNKKKINIQEAKQKLRQQVGMGSFDPFAGSLAQLEEKDEVWQDELEDVNPATKVLPGIQGSGIDISGLMGHNKNLWKSNLNAMMGKKEE